MKMNFKLFTLLITALAGFTFSTRGETFTKEIGQFEKLKINGNFSVIYKCHTDSAGFARYEAESGMDDVFFFDLKKDGTLKVQTTDPYWGKPNLPVLYLYSDFLSGVENSSDLSVTICDLVPSGAFSANQIGNGSITAENIKSTNVSASITTGNGSVNLSGKCVNANFRMLGAGLISADRLLAENVKCSILGTGSIGCWPVETLSVKGIGSTKIYYKGQPKIKKTGGGKLFELPAEDIADDESASSSDRASEVVITEESVVVSSEVPSSVSENDDDEDDDEEDDDDEDDDDDDDEEEEDEEIQTIVTADD